MLPLTNGLFSVNAVVDALGPMQLRVPQSSYGGRMAASAELTCNCEIGEILIYATSDLGQAIRHPEERWGLS